MEEDAALASVRAFLDACDAAALGFGDQDAAQPVDQASSGSDGGLRPLDAPATRSKCARANSRRGYSTTLQRRKRAEMDELRERVGELEARLSQLRASRGRLTVSAAGTTSVALARLEAAATLELRRRRRSEATNRRLQAELERCRGLRAGITRLIAKFRPQRSLDELKERALPFATVRARDPFASQAVASPGDIERQLESMLREADGVFAASAARASACWIETSRRGGSVEIRSSTPSTSSVATADSLLWITPGLSAGNEVWCSDVEGTDGNSYAKAFVMPLACRPWLPGDDDRASSATVEVPIQVHHFARKVRDRASGCLVIAMLAVLVLPPVGARARPLYVHEQSWTLVTPTTLGDGRAGSVVESCYRLGGVAEPAGDPRDGGPDSEARAMRASVSRALVRLTRRHRSMIQNWLLEANDEW